MHFLFANVLISPVRACYGIWQRSPSNPLEVLITAICLMPTLAVLLHPNFLRHRQSHPGSYRQAAHRQAAARMKARNCWVIVSAPGWQSLAVYLIAQPVLHLRDRLVVAMHV